MIVLAVDYTTKFTDFQLLVLDSATGAETIAQNLNVAEGVSMASSSHAYFFLDTDAFLSYNLQSTFCMSRFTLGAPSISHTWTQ